MTRIEAHNVLDSARDGLQLSRRIITEALVATGDIPGSDVWLDCNPDAQMPRPALRQN